MSHVSCNLTEPPGPSRAVTTVPTGNSKNQKTKVIYATVLKLTIKRVTLQRRTTIKAAILIAKTKNVIQFRLLGYITWA